MKQAGLESLYLQPLAERARDDCDVITRNIVTHCNEIKSGRRDNLRTIAVPQPHLGVFNGEAVREPPARIAANTSGHVLHDVAHILVM